MKKIKNFSKAILTRIPWILTTNARIMVRDMMHTQSHLLIIMFTNIFLFLKIGIVL